MTTPIRALCFEALAGTQDTGCMVEASDESVIEDGASVRGAPGGERRLESASLKKELKGASEVGRRAD